MNYNEKFSFKVYNSIDPGSTVSGQDKLSRNNYNTYNTENSMTNDHSENNSNINTMRNSRFKPNFKNKKLMNGTLVNESVDSLYASNKQDTRFPIIKQAPKLSSRLTDR